MIERVYLSNIARVWPIEKQREMMVASVEGWPDVPTYEDILKPKGVEVLRAEAKDGRFDLEAVLKLLGERGITRLMVEGGPTVAASFAKAGLVDEFALFRSNKVVGVDGIGALEGMALSELTDGMKRLSSETIGADTLERYERL
mgnify:CR=1 FL=1